MITEFIHYIYIYVNTSLLKHVQTLRTIMQHRILIAVRILWIVPKGSLPTRLSRCQGLSAECEVPIWKLDYRNPFLTPWKRMTWNPKTIGF